MIDINKVYRQLRTLIGRLRNTLINKKNPGFYAAEGKALFEQGKESLALEQLTKGLKFYPNSVLNHREYGFIMNARAEWKKATYHWEFVFSSKKEEYKSPNFYISYATALQEINKHKQAQVILKTAYNQYPTEIAIYEAYLNVLIKNKQWIDAKELLLSKFEEDLKKPSIDQHLLLAQIYIKLENYAQAEFIVYKGLEIDAEDIQLVKHFAEVAIKQQKWEQALERYEYLLKLYKNNPPYHILVEVSMLYQVQGNHQKATEIFEQTLDDYQTEIKESGEQFRKFILFDNGESRIEFYKNLKSVNKIIVSFDSLYMNWNEPAFGFKFLIRQDVDIVAVRRKEKGSYLQDLTQDDFIDTVKDLVAGYSDKIAYGHSLGAYSALYYASNIDCRILAMAPRLSIHPIYGRKKPDPNYKFEQNLTNNYNERISPIIVYDPKSSMDNTYVEKEVLSSFPNAILVKLPYAGHGVARHLLRMGVLKEYIEKVIDGKVPKYNRKLKSKSGNYCRLLGRKCLRRGKIDMAIHLANKAYDLLPNDKYSIKFKVEVLELEKRYDEALKLARNGVKSKPKDIYYRLILIEHHIRLKQFFLAEKEIEKSIAIIGESNQLFDKISEIEQVKRKLINIPLK